MPKEEKIKIKNGLVKKGKHYLGQDNGKDLSKEKEKIEEKCKHEWYGKRYCPKCSQIEYWGKLTGNTALDLEKTLIAGDHSKPTPIPKQKQIKLTNSDLKILHRLIQDHLNTISDISSHCYRGRIDTTEYLEELEKIEDKLGDLVNGDFIFSE